MIGEQKLQHRSLGLFNLFALRGDDHAVSADDRAGGLELWHLLNPHQHIRHEACKARSA